MDKILVKQMTDCVYLLNEKSGCSAYLVIGSEKACLIDTMESEENIAALVKTLTDKPIIVVNTHGHPDHIHGNVYFDDVYIHPADRNMAAMFMGDEQLSRRPRLPLYHGLKEGDTLGLGGKTLEIYDIPGHTEGGILLLLKEDRILFTGDAINHHCWLQLGGCLSIEKALESLERVLFLENEADRILHGHAFDFDDISLMRCMAKGLREILDGKTDRDMPYHFFGGDCLQHPFETVEGKQYSQADSVIVYREENVR